MNAQEAQQVDHMPTTCRNKGRGDAQAHFFLLRGLPAVGSSRWARPREGPGPWLSAPGYHCLNRTPHLCSPGLLSVCSTAVSPGQAVRSQLCSAGVRRSCRSFVGDVCPHSAVGWPTYDTSPSVFASAGAPPQDANHEREMQGSWLAEIAHTTPRETFGGIPPRVCQRLPPGPRIAGRVGFDQSPEGREVRRWEPRLGMAEHHPAPKCHGNVKARWATAGIILSPGRTYWQTRPRRSERAASLTPPWGSTTGRILLSPRVDE